MSGYLKTHWRQAICILLGAIFVYAGSVKIENPQAMADSIAAFGIIPVVLINPVALGLPAFEITSGVLLIVGWRRRVAALAILLAVVAYTIAIGSALARGITVDCGCFGFGPPTRARMWIDFGRDLVILSAAAFSYFSLARQTTPTRPRN